MSFGFGVGDFLAAFELAVKVRDRWTDAPKEYKSIRDETKNVENILRDIGELGTRTDLSKQREADLKKACQSCREVLAECEKLVDKYSSVQKPGSGRFKIRRAWSRLQVDPDDIRNLRDRLSAQIEQLGLLHEIIETDLIIDVNEGVQDLQSSNARHERTMIANWYSPPDFADQQTDHLSRRQSGTGRWFLARPEYESWCNQANSTLLCPGIPGSGKSVMAATVIDDLQTRYGASEEVAVAYIYCNFNRQADQKLPQMLAALTRQLFQEQDQLPDAVNALYHKHRDRATRPSADEFKAIIRLLVSLHNWVFIVIDALDECANTDQQRDRLLDEIFSLQTSKDNQVNLLVTSRFIPEITRRFSGHTQIEIRADSEDIRTYLADRMDSLARFVSQDNKLQEDIKHKIVDAADGMFLLARLQFDSLRDRTNRGLMREALGRLGKGSAALDAEYAKAIYRIERQPSGWYDLAKRVLLWITYAARELLIDELREAIAINPERDNVDLQDFLDDADQILSVCQGLVEVDQESQAVRLVHYTAQEYFDKIRDQWLPGGNLVISRSCLTYLSMEVFDQVSSRWEMELSATIKRHPFLEYSGKHWGWHASHVRDKKLLADIMTFLSNSDYLRFSSMVTLGEFYSWDEYKLGTSNIRALHICSKFNLYHVLPDLVQLMNNVNVKDSEGQTPLIYAALCDNLEAVQFLLDQPEIDINAKSALSITALGSAAYRGNTAIVSLLLAQPGIDINAGSPLSLAARERYQEIVSLLLAQPGIGINTPGLLGSTALAHAAMNNDEEMVNVLLAQSVIDVNVRDSFGYTTLKYAIYGENEKMMKLLLAHPGIHVDKTSLDYVKRHRLMDTQSISQLEKVLLKSDEGISENHLSLDMQQMNLV